MFTGLVQSMAEVVALDFSASCLHYQLKLDPAVMAGLVLGASVSVAGVCQTVVAIEGDCVSFDAIDETLACTNVGELKQGALVNIERAAKWGDEIGGHMLSGHVVDTVVVQEVITVGAGKDLLVQVDAKWRPFLLTKAYVALNGASLTIAKVSDEGLLRVCLIPETLARTTFSTACVGDRLNLEIDSITQAIVNTVERVMAKG
jgi:riboflavin synthase